MAIAAVVVLCVASVLALIGAGRLLGWVGPAAVALAALVTTVVPWHALRTSTRDLANPLAFLLLAVPLAVLLDQSGFFAAIASRIGHGRHLVLGLWMFAAAVTIVFNLDAAVVLLTPLYVRIAAQHNRDPVMLGFIPALLASLTSSVLPVSNLTNLIVADRVDVGTIDFLVHLGLPSLAAIVIGYLCYRRLSSGPATAVAAPVQPDAPTVRLTLGLVVVTWLLAGFVIGERVGVPEWVVVAVALVALVVRARSIPWREVPYEAALLALGLGVLASGAADHLPVRQLFEIGGVGGQLATIGVMAIGANAVNNLPATLVTLPQLQHHTDHAWAVLLGVNLGPTLWVTGALSTLLWQATMRRLGHVVSARRYAAVGLRVGTPALVVASGVHALLQLAS